MIKAIETIYKGYHFRSRLEARWAVFFDALGIEWEYEPEGFELPSGNKYLPDFRINSLRAWVEIKPNEEWEEGDKEKIEEFSESWSYRPDHMMTNVLCGTPYADSGGQSYRVWRHFGKGCCNGFMDSTFIFCPVCESVSIQRKPELQYHDGTKVSWYCWECDCGSRGRKHPDLFSKWFSKGDFYAPPENDPSKSPVITRAYAAARSARFEHGQSGATI